MNSYLEKAGKILANKQTNRYGANGKLVPPEEQIHSCSYYCNLPACIKRQRDELRDKLDSASVRVLEELRINPDYRELLPATPIVEREASGG